uniref:collagen alpha-1(XVIII) chain-like n=1 Tax=Callithrix jacchus TaxID=9483 RepID=UPI0023DCF8C8|nr:collagen alpha-1(XVIII) chain-like [Callithrix jacchus]
MGALGRGRGRTEGERLGGDAGARRRARTGGAKILSAAGTSRSADPRESTVPRGCPHKRHSRLGGGRVLNRELQNREGLDLETRAQRSGVGAISPDRYLRGPSRAEPGLAQPRGTGRRERRGPRKGAQAGGRGGGRGRGAPARRQPGDAWTALPRPPRQTFPPRVSVSPGLEPGFGRESFRPPSRPSSPHLWDGRAETRREEGIPGPGLGDAPSRSRGRRSPRPSRGPRARDLPGLAALGSRGAGTGAGAAALPPPPAPPLPPLPPPPPSINTFFTPCRKAPFSCLR